MSPPLRPSLTGRRELRRRHSRTQGQLVSKRVTEMGALPRLRTSSLPVALHPGGNSPRSSRTGVNSRGDADSGEFTEGGGLRRHAGRQRQGREEQGSRKLKERGKSHRAAPRVPELPRASHAVVGSRRILAVSGERRQQFFFENRENVKKGGKDLIRRIKEHDWFDPRPRHEDVVNSVNVSTAVCALLVVISSVPDSESLS